MGGFSIGVSNKARVSCERDGFWQHNIMIQRVSNMILHMESMYLCQSLNAQVDRASFL